MIEIKNRNQNDIKIEEKAYQAYLKLKKFLKEKKIEIEISSAYRSKEEQESLREELYKIKGEEYVNSYVAEKDASEHTTGLAIDLVVLIHDRFEDETDKAYLILEKIHPYLKDFGFILRYPKGKEKITGYQYDPWHIRYVGNIPAKIIMDNNLQNQKELQM